MSVEAQVIVNKNGHLRAILVASASGRWSAQESKSPLDALKGYLSKVPAEDPGEIHLLLPPWANPAHRHSPHPHLLISGALISVPHPPWGRHGLTARCCHTKRLPRCSQIGPG